ncbi:MAG: pyridoxal phosphate-dependent aminotransferase [Chloroflexota bacterium]|nr:pyridoxal phosphate-dependent aminotransferase [Chloroflexota bacterium]
MKIAQRMNRLGTETAFEVLVKARALEAQGRDIVHLEVGEPDFATPENIVQAGIRALKDGKTKYTPSAGIPELRAAIAQKVSQTRGVKVTADQVVVTPGAKPIMFFSILALVEPGDEVLYPVPGFPIYESMINYCGGTPVPYLLREENHFRFDPDEFRAKANAKTQMIILNSPHNPTGGVLEPDDLQVVAEVAQKHDITVFTDEIYWRVLYDGTFSSLLSIPGMAERTILLDGFSKTYSMTGWRLGWGVMPEHLVPHITRLQTNSNSCVAGFTQYAGLEALTGPQSSVDAMVSAFRERRDTIVDGLNAVPGFKALRPRGAFYAFPNTSGTGWDSRKLADYMLNEAGVACLSGTAFGSPGEGYLRFSYANSLENIKKALLRIREAAEKIQD